MRSDGRAMYAAGLISLATGLWAVSVPTTERRLFDEVARLQQQSDRPYVPFLSWSKRAGIYRSELKLYFHGPPPYPWIRDFLGIFDNNMFTTAWVTTSLLEAHVFGRGPRPSLHQNRLALRAIANFTNRNGEHFPNSVMTFWPQVHNATAGSWQSTPENLLSFFRLIDHLPWKLIEEVLSTLHLKDLVETIKGLLSMRSIFLQAFHIPSDFDDTFVNLGLGAFLMEWKEYFPEEQRLWQMQNPNIDSVFEALRKYTYRPFSGDRNVNSIDTRTYYYLRGFLEDAKKNGKDVALVPTWVQNIEEVRTMYYKGVNMPFQVNNVDITVSANAVYGITAGVLSGLLEKSLLDDLEIQQIYRNTSSMIAWGLVNDLSGRRDLALMYYPSLFEFYWFTARTYSLLHRKAISGGLPHKVLEETYKLYGNALKEHVTYVILNSSKEDEEGMLYFDDFIGNADLSIFNKTVNRAEDRIFTTSMAVNALLSTWSVLDKERGHHLRWDAETPTEVKNSIARAAKWLNKHVLDGHYKPWNAFFSGSVKGFSTIPFLYPSNRYEYLNGTKIPPGTKTVNGPTVLAMEGCISEEEYKKLMNKTHMGHYKTPTHFEGFNAENTVFPFWSSDTYTYSTSMLALAQFRILDQPLSPGI